MAIFHLATSKLKAGQIDSAIEQFGESHKIEDSPRALIQDGLGCCYHERQDYDKAIGAFNNAIKAEPRNIEFLKNRAQCYYDMTNYEQCISDLATALEINSKDP